MSVWFTADLHLGHRNILAYTQRYAFLSPMEIELCEKDKQAKTWKPSFDALDRMDEHLIQQINKCVGNTGFLWILGDVCFGPKDLEQYLKVAQRYRDRIKTPNIGVVLGNHDRDELKYVYEQLVVDRNDNPILDRRGDRQYKNVYKAHMIRHEGVRIEMNHYAHAVWAKSHRRSWMLYGHSHANAEPWLDRVMPGRRSIDVGVDNAKKVLGEYRPFSFQELHNILADRPGVSIDHHKEVGEEE